MEDFQEQEYEFLRRLEEEKLDRRKLLRRGLVAGAGLTILSMPAGALDIDASTKAARAMSTSRAIRDWTGPSR